MNRGIKIYWICACFLFLLKSIAMGQGAFPGPKSIGPAESFKLTVEPAWIAYGKPNTMGKSEMEKKLFPDDNKMVGFFFIDNVLRESTQSQTRMTE
ncbi:hypothetical protein [Proteiniphilum sp. X52]|uniref:hypothetical protein n=1 Tax=Proteiniphilum sp. X52 TaxID=2382159 RepID=UPI000F40E20B|nr:hypothetical protein [Proteiniphilum sp. X52]RNC65629.1 hypothetical protein D7D25_05620 [Proteiniphilum sp. X52]